MEQLFSNNVIDRMRVNVVRALDAAEAVRNVQPNDNSRYVARPEFDFFRNVEEEASPAGRLRWGPYRAMERPREPIPWDKIKHAQSRLTQMQLQQQSRMEMHRHNAKNNASSIRREQKGVKIASQSEVDPQEGGSGLQASPRLEENAQQMNEASDNTQKHRKTLAELLDELAESPSEEEESDEEEAPPSQKPDAEDATGDGDDCIES